MPGALKWRSASTSLSRTSRGCSSTALLQFSLPGWRVSLTVQSRASPCLGVTSARSICRLALTSSRVLLLPHGPSTSSIGSRIARSKLSLTDGQRSLQKRPGRSFRSRTPSPTASGCCSDMPGARCARRLRPSTWLRALSRRRERPCRRCERRCMSSVGIVAAQVPGLQDRIPGGRWSTACQVLGLLESPKALVWPPNSIVVGVMYVGF
jgi:hypothetical protein